MSDEKSPYQRIDDTLPCEAVWHNQTISSVDRAKLLDQTPRCIWLTGLSGSGKSTVANALDATLHHRGVNSFLLDGDNVRHGLNKDLGMTESDRAENIRRVGEVARLMVDAGLVVICAFISPYRRDRQMVRSMFNHGQFIEAYLDTPLSVCEERDPKGLYKKARAGIIKQFTGISDPYEAPDHAEITIDTSGNDVGASVNAILKVLAK
ncbi:adenylyl-sulfate kinase [Gilvimarinus xylanilyticus]|uniref:Adenylyl-sulfate kinase n=1 Tax=Gilvimarinus xylanilyticus TaxID=2944139 RepID=A0A9X2I1A3_9GAMM|nr:adenylyl-sulfate kinase [Gilvimarinus xylanilyticus]MCP8900301.1 adenylyl-sulfate kinase [Gilvimarinus xylanilyticus]